MAYRDRNPFEDEDNFEDISDTPELARIKQEKELYQQRMIDSSYRSLRMINESQGIASETAEELRKQREQLERTDKNLDKISGDLKQTDRNITSLKSIWGTMSNWFKKPVQTDDPHTEDSRANALKINQDIRRDNNEIKNNLRTINQRADLSWEGDSDANVRQSSTDAIVDKNLDNMMAGLEILKNQGMALGAEIDDHNVLLDRIQRKTETADANIENQNLRIRKILK
ncbi:soluble NSF attachment protein 29-like isoform X2 [Hydractinia symbiolongicarpus]|nr:soluble NSF attachment protein 29-like isoform X2 [Hydractinia symbiolongicarpus]